MNTDQYNEERTDLSVNKHTSTHAQPQPRPQRQPPQPKPRTGKETVQPLPQVIIFLIQITEGSNHTAPSPARNFNHESRPRKQGHGHTPTNTHPPTKRSTNQVTKKVMSHLMSILQFYSSVCLHQI